MNKPIDLTPLKEYAASLTARLISQKEDNKSAPYYARLDEMLPILQADFKEVMRDLVREKTLTCYSDLNGRAMFEFTQPK